MKGKLLYLQVISLLATATWLSSCGDDAPAKPVLPTVTTTAISDITTSGAKTGGNVTNDGGSAVTARGVCWSTSENPTIDDDKTSNGTGKGEFESMIESLPPNVKYYVRAYATNKVGTAYGDQLSFTTGIALPTLTTTAATEITSNSAKTGGNITSDGGSAITARGICWSTAHNPTIADSKTTDGNGTGAFQSNMSNLTRATTYYVRSYATNTEGTAYGSEVEVTTLPELPTLTSSLVSSRCKNVTVSGNITDDGGAITERGVVYGINPNPTIGDNVAVEGGTQGGVFSKLVSNLSLSTTYYLRAYAKNASGISYGNQVQITTNGNCVYDADGNDYLTVTINEKVWMGENLKTTHYNNGDAIPSTEVAVYNNQSNNLTLYGRLYTWIVVNDSKGVCPSGMHIPTKFEWEDLINFVGGASVAGSKLKESGNAHWSSGNSTNDYLFTALPGGYRQIFNSDNDFVGITNQCLFWTADESGAEYAYYFFIRTLDDVIISGGVPKTYQMSLRCVGN